MSKPTSIINPRSCKLHKIRIEIEQMYELAIPHVHIHWNSEAQNFCCCVRLDKPETVDHNSINYLPDEVKNTFIECMSTLWHTQAFELADKTFQRATGYEAAVQIWEDTYEDGNYSKFILDKRGLPIMPDYSSL